MVIDGTQVDALSSQQKEEVMIICLEGPDFCGKSSTAARIAVILEQHGFQGIKPARTHVYRCPGSTRLGEMLRGPLKDASFKMSEEVLALAFAAVDLDAMQMAEGHGQECHVVMDRCGLSNLAYRKAFGQTIALELLERMGNIIVRPPFAKLVIMDIDESTAANRMKERGNVSSDRFEQGGLERWNMVRAAYLSPTVSRHADRIVHIDEQQDVDTCARMILAAIA